MKPQVMGTPGLVGLPWDLRPRAMQLCDRAGQDPGSSCWLSGLPRTPPHGAQAPSLGSGSYRVQASIPTGLPC